MNPMRVVILNPCLEITPLNFRKWLREKLATYEKAGVVKDEQVTGILFLTKVYKGQVGVKNLEKMLASTLAKKKWVSAFEIIITRDPISDADAQSFLDEVQSNYRIEEQLKKLDEDMPVEGSSEQPDEVADTLLGYGPKRLTADGAVDLSVEPQCVVRKARDSDFADILLGSTGIEVGQWYVYGSMGDADPVLSAAFADEKGARLHAEAVYGAIIFMTPVEIQAAQMQEQMDALVS